MRKIRRLLAFQMALFVLLGSISTPSRAVLPALAYVAPYIAPLVISSAGRSAVISLGAAANDAVWASSAGGWVTSAIAAGLAVLLTGDTESVEVQLKDGEVLTHAANTSGNLWTVVNAPGDWAGTSYQQILRGVATSHANALEIARSRLAIHYGGADCSVPSSDPVAVDATWNKGWVHCNKSGWSTYVIHEIQVTNNSVNVEQTDGIRRVIYSNGSFQNDPTDPDNNRGPMPQTTWDLKPQVEWQQYDYDSEQDITYQIAATAQGVAIRSLSTADQVNYEVRQVVTDSARVPYQFTQQSINYDPVNLPNLDTVVGGSSSANTNPTTNIQFPSDYARQGEAQSAADSLKLKLDNTSEVADPVIAGEWSFFDGVFNNLLGWTMPGHVSECPTPSFTFNGNIYVMNAHCQLVQDHFNVIQTAMTVVWVLISLFIILGA